MATLFTITTKLNWLLPPDSNITAIKLGLSAYGTIDGVTNTTFTSSTSVALPLPVFGFKGEYTVIDKYKGTLISTALNIES